MNHRQLLIRRILLVYYLLAIVVVLRAQSPKADSLRIIIRDLQGIEKVQSMNLLIDELITKNPDESLALALESIQLADSLKDAKLQTETLYHLGLVYLAKNNYSEASTAFNNAMAKSSKIKNHDLELLIHLGQAEMFYGILNFDSAVIMLETAETIAKDNGFDSRFPAIYNNMAKIEEEKGDLPQAVQLYLQCAEIYARQNDETELAIVYNNISTVHLNLKNFPEAIYYMKLAIEINKKQNQVQNLLMNDINMGIIYMEADSLDLAESWYHEAISEARKTNDEFQLARTYMSLANLLTRQSNYLAAKSYFDSSLYLCQKNKLDYGILLNKINLGEFYSKTGDYAKAISNMEEALKEIVQYHLPNETAELYQLLYIAWKKSGNPKKALQFYELHYQLQDSIAGAETKKTILELEKKYEKERSVREIAELQQNIIREKAKNRFYIIAFLILFILSLSAGFYIFLRRREALMKATLAEQENLILKENMEIKSRELVANALQLAQMNEQIIQVNKQLKDIKSNLNDSQMAEINAVISNLENNVFSKSWKEFETRFQQVHEGFHQKLQDICPGLTPTEVKLCSFMRLNLTSKDISLLTNRSIGTIDNARSSIRKKLNLNSDSNLTSFLLSL